MRRLSEKQKKIILWVLLGLVVLGVATVIGSAWLRAGPILPGDPRYGLTPRQPSITYEVFKPAIDPYNNLVDFFRPSALRVTFCDVFPASPQRLPSWLFSLVRGCY